MATIRAYTTLEQSHRLIKILPLESADMCYIKREINNTFIETPIVKPIGNVWKNLPCWSLASLLSILPNEVITDKSRFECHYQIHIRKYDGGDNTTLYQIAYGNNRGLSGSWHDMIDTGERENLIDACVAMIEKLHELNLL